jgi:hypothetical protein
MTDPSTQSTLHVLLACVRDGAFARHQDRDGGWQVTLHHHAVPTQRRELVRWGLSILAQQHLIRWWPQYAPTQAAKLTDNGTARLREWNTTVLLGTQPTVNLDTLNNSRCGGDDDGEAA